MSAAVIPSACRSILNIQVLPCIADPRNGNCYTRCFDDAVAGSALPPFDFLFVPDYAESCAEFEEPLCWPRNLPGCCPPCARVFRSLYRCIIMETPGLDAGIITLLQTCPLNCVEFENELGLDAEDDGADGNMTDTNTTRFLLN